jgi:hypothetical protein
MGLKARDQGPMARLGRGRWTVERERAGASTSPRPELPAGSHPLTSRADQHLDLPVALRAQLGGVIALRSLRRETARLHAVG